MHNISLFIKKEEDYNEVAKKENTLKFQEMRSLIDNTNTKSWKHDEPVKTEGIRRNNEKKPDTSQTMHTIFRTPRQAPAQGLLLRVFLAKLAYLSDCLSSPT